MLKFQDNHATVMAIFEDFILTVDVIVNGLYWKYVPESVFGKNKI